MQPGDYIYGCTTNITNGDVEITRAVISRVTPNQVHTAKWAHGFGLECRTIHRRLDVFSTPAQALKAYRMKVVQAVLMLRDDIGKKNVTLASIDEHLTRQVTQC